MEKIIKASSGLIGVFIQLALAIFLAYLIINDVSLEGTGELEMFDFILPVVVFVAMIVMFGSYIIVNPGEAVVLSFMGTYKGSIKSNGFFIKNPFYGSAKLSTRLNNYETKVLSVNDKNGVPIQIAAVVSYQTSDTYKANYGSDDYEEYIIKQFEISLRTLAKSHTYEELSGEDKDFISDLTSKVTVVGVTVTEAKITNLNYAADIASAMLQKQQAQAISDARQIIANNAVGIAKHAIDEMKIEMTEPQRAVFLTNLVMVLCSEKSVTPVVTVSA